MELTWYLSILLAVLNYMEIVSCGLRANSHARKVTLKKISDQKYFSSDTTKIYQFNTWQQS